MSEDGRPDLDLARRAASGDEDAWREIYTSTREKLFSLLSYHIGNRDEALDVLQETYVGAVKGIDVTAARAAWSRGSRGSRSGARATGSASSSAGSNAPIRGRTYPAPSRFFPSRIPKRAPAAAGPGEATGTTALRGPPPRVVGVFVPRGG